jgi:hypothetical protein
MNMPATKPSRSQGGIEAVRLIDPRGAGLRGLGLSRSPPLPPRRGHFAAEFADPPLDGRPRRNRQILAPAKKAAATAAQAANADFALRLTGTPSLQGSDFLL